MVRVFFSTGGAKFNNAERTIIFIHGAGMTDSMVYAGAFLLIMASL